MLSTYNNNLFDLFTLYSNVENDIKDMVINKYKDHYKLTFIATGLDKKDIEVTYQDSYITVKSNSEEKLFTKNINQKIKLRNVNQDKIEASLDKGILTITAYFEENSKNFKTINIT